MAQNQHGSGHQGQVKDPEHDGRLKENREAGRTKGTTPGSAERQHEAGHSGGSHQQGGGHSGGGQQHQAGSGGGESDDLKSREYRDAQGNVHHHTHTAGRK